MSEGFADQAIASTLSTQLSWSHFIELLPIKDPLARDFYAEMCRIERWDVRTLRQKIGGMLYQRTALSRKPEAVISAEIAKLRDGQITRAITLAAQNETRQTWPRLLTELGGPNQTSQTRRNA